MNRGPQQDPGGDLPPPGVAVEHESELTDLKDQFEQQQVLIAQLKEMLRKTDQTNVSQEKMDRYASTLSKMTERAKKSKLKKESTAGSSEKDGSKSGSETPVNEKITLLRRQLEENKAKLAERGKNQKEIGDMVTQLKAQFDDSLQLINDTSSNFSFVENKADYSKESSSDELYNILVTKEKKITDLNCKMQKLEATVLDLQENLKEKDCVIDARTKAITLMTESLSKKSKTTQDTLDETRDQMRNMQEEFVKLENEMKARQMKLLDELRLKNVEIAELQEVNENLNDPLKTTFEAVDSKNSKEITDFEEQILELQNVIKKLEESNNNLIEKNKNEKEDFENQIIDLKKSLDLSEIKVNESQSKIFELESIIKIADSSKRTEEKTEDQSGEMIKLKKDLDDINKNIIKVKAEHKKKIKLLNKKIDSFKKLGDLNAHIVKLSEENDNMKEKIAELEEEKGNYQLRMMDSFTHDSPSEENLEELEKLKVSLEEKTMILNDLQTENISLKKQIEMTNEKLQELSDLQNEKVTSEMTSIQLEELSEKLHQEKNEIISSKESLQNENAELLDKLETLNREKSEIQSKLDHYIQENMELIDKFEKLSAEKVSSAESIEIVENLTQQEKLELEEYQKNLDPHSGKLKMSEEHLESTPDLNDSVNQLTEETSELLQKIELFTVERREVMEKMESLNNENSQLNLKLKQIENNRDLLTETYEQVQSEKEELDNKIEVLQKEKKQLEDCIESMKTDYNVDENEDLKKKLYDLEGEYVKLVEENEKLCKELKINSEMIHEKDNMESDLKNARNKIEELETTLHENLEEISYYRSVMEDNKEELIKSTTHLHELQQIINSKDLEVERYKLEIDDLRLSISDFSKTITNLENDNKSNKENINKIELLDEQLKDLKDALNENLGQISEYENELEENSKHMKELNQQLKELSNKNLELQNILEENNDERNKVVVKLNNEIDDLKQQIKSKDEMFHKVSSEMKDKFILLQKQTDNNTESLEDIREPLQKKIEELTNKNTALVEKMKKIAANLKKKTQNCQELENQLHSTQERWEAELNEKNCYIKEIEEKIEVFRTQENMYQVEVQQLQHMVDQKIQIDVPQGRGAELRSELSLQEELSGVSIIPETGSKSGGDTTFSKIQELELIIETQENDISNYKERISGLEEMLSKIDERRETLEQKTNELGVQLEEKSLSFEEISKTEDMLEEKLKNLSKYNEEVEKKLEKISRDNESLMNENKNLKDSTEKLKQKLIVSQERVNELLQVEQSMALLEQDLENSRNHTNNLEQELRKLEIEKVQLEESAKTDLDKLDNDWQVQFEVISKERSELTVFCEKLNEKNSELTESERVLLEKVNELETKLEKSYELQESSDQELIAQSDNIKHLELMLEGKNLEIEQLSSRQNELIDKINNLELEITNLNASLHETEKELSVVKNLLEQAKNELDQLTATNQELQHKPQTHPTEVPEKTEKPNPLFTWHDQEEDPFNFVSVEQQNQSQPLQHPPPTEENSQEELLQKIKTLEFMLKNVENERDDMFNQCSHLSNELMRFVYEKEHQQNMGKQVLSSVETTDASPSLEGVTEPVCVKKEAYLCYPDGTSEENVLVPSVESQILPEDFYKDPVETKVGLRSIEFTQTKDIVDNMVPFGEELCKKKETYLCYPEDELQAPSSSYFNLEESQIPLKNKRKELTENQSAAKISQPDQATSDAFGDDDDGWGWNPEEARLEEQHKKEYDENPLRIKIMELEDRIKVMTIENERRSKEYQELQVKSGKLIKKLKELKNKNEKLQQGKKQENNDMFDLESAIQDELKIQIETLEKKIVDVGSELSKEKNEKKTLQKKIETLSSSHQRMSDLKEKQDIEMVMWQRKAEKLKQKLDQFEWSDSAGTPEKTKLHKKELGLLSEGDVLEMQKTITYLTKEVEDLTEENDELEALLKDEKALRITAEKSKSVEPILDNMKTESEYMEIVNLKIKLEGDINEITVEKKRLQDELNEVIKKNDEQLEELKKLHEEKLILEKVVQERDSMVKQLTDNLEQSRSENVKLEKEKAFDEQKIQSLLQEVLVLDSTHNDAISHRESLLYDTINILKEEKEEIEVVLQEKEKILDDLKKKESEIENFKLSLEEKTSLLKNDLEEQIKTTERLMLENETLSIRKKELEEQVANLLHQIEEKNTAFEDRVDKLNQDWQIAIDQRGSDVAESWKLHLDSRETEFDQIQVQLKKELHDVEEKCNSLVNENNELRKNVDTEIRNEVDRVSAMQQQINERQQYIHDLSQVVNDKELQLKNLEEQISQQLTIISDLHKSSEEKDVKINELHIIVDATQKQFDEKRIIVESIVKKLEEQSVSPILFDIESITEEMKKQIVNQEEISKIHKDISDKDSTISNMQSELASKIEELGNHQLTIENYKRTIEELQKQLKNASDEEKLIELNSKLNEKETLLVDSRNELVSKLKDLTATQQALEEYKSVSVENERQVKELNDRLAEKEDMIANLSNQLQHLQNLELNETAHSQNLQHSLQQYQLQYNELQSNLNDKNSLIDAMNRELENQHQIHLEREVEVTNLKTYLEELQKSHGFEQDQLEKDKNSIIETLSQETEVLKNQLDQTQIYIDEIQSEKEMAQGSINYLQSELQEQLSHIQQLNEQMQTYKNQNEQLGLELNEKLQKQHEDQVVRLSEEDKQISELQAIIEDQVLKIEELKNKLYEKSNDYDSLIAEMDVRKDDLKVPDHVVSTRPPMGQGQLIGPTCEDDLNEWVSRPELDIALYMLHQRDVRCEELTVELTQLLEERDTLQLRLSNALREKEEFKKVALESGKLLDITTMSPESSPSKGAIPKGRVSEIVLKSSGTELATEAEESLPKESSDDQLEHKLSELKNVGYRRDKTLLDEQQHRRLQQLSIMQQHMDEASRLPSEAAARLVDANYTLSRDVQSPSKVLLNWLWGRSTPKVNEL